MKVLTIPRDEKGQPVPEALPQSDFVNSQLLEAATPAVHTIPAGARWARFAADNPFWYRLDGAAAIPVATVLDGSSSTANPNLVFLDGAATIGLVAAAATILTIEFFA